MSQRQGHEPPGHVVVDAIEAQEGSSGVAVKQTSELSLSPPPR